MIPVKFCSSSFDSYRAISSFYPQAQKLRSYFDHTFQNPLQAKKERFCWDYWTVKNQYQHLRTPASAFFPDALFQPFLEHLLNWGRSTLGCQMISHPWLSSYIDESFQKLHSDVPHGPFSFVFSLTDWRARTFTGGETLLAKPKLLRYFSKLQSDQSHEEKDFFEKIEPKFNQLTLFDPRYPHGVERVSGVDSILASRLVIHGWFTEPNVMLEGALSSKTISKPLDQFAGLLIDAFNDQPYFGLLSLRLKINPNGKIAMIEVLTSHLLSREGHVISKKIVAQAIASLDFTFPKASGTSWITLPLQLQ